MKIMKPIQILTAIFMLAAYGGLPAARQKFVGPIMPTMPKVKLATRVRLFPQDSITIRLDEGSIQLEEIEREVAQAFEEKKQSPLVCVDVPVIIQISSETEPTYVVHIITTLTDILKAKFSNSPTKKILQLAIDINESLLGPTIEIDPLKVLESSLHERFAKLEIYNCPVRFQAALNQAFPKLKFGNPVEPATRRRQLESELKKTEQYTRELLQSLNDEREKAKRLREELARFQE